MDFTVEVERALRVLDGGVAVFDGSQGVEPQSETVWRQADKYNVPRVAFVNKMDKLGADFNMSVESIATRLTDKGVAIQIPHGAASEFKGIVDLVEMKYHTFEGEHGENHEIADIPAELADEASMAREEMIEKISGFDDDVAMKYLEGEELSVAEIKKAIRAGVIANNLYPILCGSALKNAGVQLVLDAVVDYLPSPIDRGGITGVHADTGDEEKENQGKIIQLQLSRSRS